MGMLSGADVTAAGLVDRRKLGQGLHAWFVADDLGAAVRFLVAVGELGGIDEHLDARLRRRSIDLKLVSDDAVYRDQEGVEHRVEWVTRADVELAGRISAIATDPHPTPRQRFHVDVQVPYDAAEGGVAAVVAAVAAGATAVDDSRAPATTVLADPDGDKACVGTFRPAPEPASAQV